MEKFLAVCPGRRDWAMRASTAGLGAIMLVTGFGPTPNQPAFAAGDLLVAPTRVVLEGRTRSSYVTLVNKGTETATYRISVVNRRMREDGSFEIAESAQPGERFATGLIRYAPRRVVLAPSASQTIRILVRKPRNLAEGEYRSHLLFRAMPEIRGSGSVERPNAGAPGLSIKLIPIFGITIPVIIRHGTLKSEVSIIEAELRQARGASSPTLNIRLGRSGDRSVHGDLQVDLMASSEAGRTIGTVRGISVYTPNRTRIVKVPIERADIAKVRGSTVLVRFNAIRSAGGQILAENRLEVR